VRACGCVRVCVLGAFVSVRVRVTVSVRVLGACVCCWVLGACVLLLGARAGFVNAGCAYRGARACHVMVYCEQNQALSGIL